MFDIYQPRLENVITMARESGIQIKEKIKKKNL